MIRAMPPSHVWVDGRLLPADQPHLSAFDRGFQLGDGVFETLRARGGHVTELDRHLERLRHSAQGLGIDLPGDAARRIGEGIREVIDAEGLEDAALRITVSRGAFLGRGLLPAEGLQPTIVVQAWPVTPPPRGHLEQGLHLIPSTVRRDPTNPLAALKTTSRADYVFARLEAKRAGADDALFLTTDGHLSEATSANLFLVRRGNELATPSLDCAVLPGTTRDWLLQWAPTVGLEPVESRLSAADLASATEAFISASVMGILPVTRWDGEPIGDGKPGPWTRRAREDREGFIREGSG
jgi:branched-chain amino acid aminotransferase